MLKNITITCLFLLLSISIMEAQDRMGFSGLFGTYNMNSMPNYDDKMADQRLDFVTTFKYAAGFEKATWFNSNFGIGGQASYWLSGQDYKGADTVAKTTFKASTTINYTKMGIYLYHKSFNRYNPNTRFRFVSYFGPYVAFNTGYSDNYSLFDAAGKKISEYTMIPAGAENNLDKNKVYLKLKKPIYKTFDFGFTVAPGFQIMITPKFGVGLNIRADVGATGVENTGDLRQKLDIAPYEASLVYWDGLYAKYTVPTVAKDIYDRRAKTYNTSFGASLSLRVYSTPQFAKY
jgi:hypothetical protein